MTDVISAVDPSRRVDGTVRRFLRNPFGMTAAAVLVLIILACALAPLLSPFDPNTAALSDSMLTPNALHPLGTDRAGRDLLSRLLWGGAVTLAASALALAIAMGIGVPAGLIAGYFGRSFDSVSGWIVNLLMALPATVVLLAVRAVVGPSVWISMSVFGVLLAPTFFRLVRSAVIDVRREIYIDAAKVSGLTDGRIMGRHVLRVVRAPVIIQAALVGGVAIAVQSGLEFLGIGDPEVPTWGSLLNDAFSNIYAAPWMLIAPGIALTITSATLVLLANAIRDALEDRGGRRARRRRVAPAGTPAPAGVATDRSLAKTAVGTGSDQLLNIEHLAIAYCQDDNSDKVVVNDVSFTVQRGEVLGLVGESGSGKTQTAFSILGLLPEGGRVTNGTMTLDGVDLLTLSQRGRRALLGTSIGYVPQEPMSNLDPSFRVGSQLTEPLQARLGMSAKDAREKSLHLLDRVGISDPRRAFDAYPYEISGGMAQRVLIAGAVAGNPRLLIADECTTALDVTVQADVLRLLRELQAENGMGVLLVTHNLGVVADICDRVAVMQQGRVVETNDVEPLFASPAHPYTRTLLGSTLENAEPRRRLLSEGIAA